MNKFANGFHSSLLCGLMLFQVFQAASAQGVPPVDDVHAGEAPLHFVLEKRLQYPRSSQVHGEEGRCVVRLRVDETGVIRSTKVVQGTGFDALDRECHAVFDRMKDLPVLAANRQAATRLYDINIDFRLADEVPHAERMLVESAVQVVTLD